MANDIHNDEFYTKYLETWNNRSSIRTRPEKVFDVNEEDLFFPCYIN